MGQRLTTPRSSSHLRKAARLSQPKDNQKCPCGSGIAFGKCCAKQKLIWSRGADGSWSKKIRLSSEAIEIIRAEEREFKEIFGRPMGNGDFIFFRTIAMTTDDSLRRDTDAAIDSAN